MVCGTCFKRLFIHCYVMVSEVLAEVRIWTELEFVFGSSYEWKSIQRTRIPADTLFACVCVCGARTTTRTTIKLYIKAV